MQGYRINTFIKLRPTFEDEFMLSKNFIQTGENQFTFTDIDNLVFQTSHIHNEQTTNKIVFELSICEHITKSIAHHTQPLLFFFGQPLSGKTYTIEGLISKDSTTQEPGILHHIFSFLQNQRADVSLAVLVYNKDQLYDAQNIQQQQLTPGQSPKFTSVYTQETINDIIFMSRKKVKQLKFEACSKLYQFKYIANGSVFNYFVVDSCLYLDQQLNLTLQQALNHLLSQQQQKQSKGSPPGLRNNKLLHYLSPCLNANVADILFCLNISGCEKFCDFRKIQDIFIKIFSGQRIQQDITQTFTRSQLNTAGSLVQSQSGMQRIYQQPTVTITKQPSVYKSQLLNDLYSKEIQQNGVIDQGQIGVIQQSMSPSYVSNAATINFTDVTQIDPQVQQHILDVEDQSIYQQQLPQPSFQSQSRVQSNNSINMLQENNSQLNIQDKTNQFNNNQVIQQNTFNEMEQFSQMLSSHPQMLTVNPGNTQLQSQLYGQQNSALQSNNDINRIKFQQIGQQEYNKPQVISPHRDSQRSIYQPQQLHTKQSIPQQQQNNGLTSQYSGNINYENEYQSPQNQNNMSQMHQSSMQQVTQMFSNVSDLQSYLDQQKTLTINTAKQFVQQKLQEKNVLIETLRIQVNDLQQQLDEQKIQYQIAKNLQQTEKELSIQQNEQAQGYKTHISQLLAQLNISKVQSSDYKQELDRQIFICNQQVDQMNQYKAKIQSLETEIGTIQAQSTAKDDQLLIREQQITDLNNELLEWKTKCNKFNLELNELRPYKDVAYEMEVEITDYKSVISQKEVEIEQLKNEVVSLRCIVQQQSGAHKVEEIQL